MTVVGVGSGSDRPAEVFPAWSAAQEIVRSCATAPVPSVAVMRSRGFLPDASGPGRSPT